MEKENQLDPFGLKAAAETGKLVATSVVSFLSLICRPYAEEYGADLALSKRAKRLLRIHRIVKEADGLLTHDGTQLQLSADERIVHEVIEHGSKTDDELLISMWGGLLAASCVEGLPSDSNLTFVNALKNLTSTQAKIIKYICDKCKVIMIENTIALGVTLTVDIETLKVLTGIDDVAQLDYEIDSLSTGGFLSTGGKGFNIKINADFVTSVEVNLRPSTLLLTLYAKTQGFRGQIDDYYRERVIPLDNTNKPVSYLAIG